jgi:hypothetical protein
VKFVRRYILLLAQLISTDVNMRVLAVDCIRAIAKHCSDGESVKKMMMTLRGVLTGMCLSLLSFK